MKKALLLGLCFAMSYSLMAQETVKQKEIGIVFKNLDNFELTYKTGTNTALWRFNTLFISGRTFPLDSEDLTNRHSSFGLGLRLGKEFRKNIDENLEFRYGADISFLYSRSKEEYLNDAETAIERTHKINSYRPSLNLVIGLNYVVNQKIVIGAELLPAIGYSFNKNVSEYADGTSNTDLSNHGISYGLSNSSAALTIAYRF